MARRLLLGGLLGAILGAAIGLGHAFAFRTPMTPTMSMLVAIAVGIVVVPLVRKAPWRHASALETILRVVLGAVLGAGVAYVVHRAFDPELPFALPPVPGGARFSEHAWLFPTVVGFVIGAVVDAFGGADTPASPTTTVKDAPSRAEA